MPPFPAAGPVVIHADGVAGPDTIFSFGQYMGRTFQDITYHEPGYYFWSTSQQPRGARLRQYIDWVEDCFLVNREARTFTEHATPQHIEAPPPRGGSLVP